MRQKWSKFWMKFFGKLERSKLNIISHQILITKSKVMASLSYCSNFCPKAPKMVKILDEKFWKVCKIQIEHHTKISLKSDHWNQSYWNIFNLSCEEQEQEQEQQHKRI